MQKKPKIEEVHPSDWEKNIRRQEQKEKSKQFAIWAGIILISLLGLAGLVKLAERSGPSTTPVATENLKEVSAKNDIIMGNPDAQVTMIEYADFQCPGCATYNPIIEQVLSNYPNNVRVVYRFFPLASIHKNAYISAQAAYAAWKMGKFIEMKDELFNNQKSWENIDNADEEFVKYAVSIGLDADKFRELMNSKEAQDAVKAGEADAISTGLNSTPTFFLGNKKITFRDFEELKSLIDAEISGVTVTVTQPPLQ
jgi:protein-disulfide isomerase